VNSEEFYLAQACEDKKVDIDSMRNFCYSSKASNQKADYKLAMWCITLMTTMKWPPVLN